MLIQPAECVIVIGGGPAGLMAAGQAAAAGVKTILLERNDHLGAKLRLTGGGRCNLTNLADMDTFLQHFFDAPGDPPASRQFLRSVLARFSAPDLLALFDSLGIATLADDEGRVFPASNDAGQVVEALSHFARSHGVDVRFGSRASQLDIEGGRARAVILAKGERLAAGAVIVATGGASYPRTGSTGDGYRLAAQAGHTLRPVRPALVPLLLAGPEPRAMMGVSLRDVAARLLVDGRPRAAARGDLLFTHFGVSGPLVLNLSHDAVWWLHAGNARQELAIDLRPDLTAAALDAELRAELDRHGKRSVRNMLRAPLGVPDKMVPVFLVRAGIPPGKPAHQVTAAERARLCELLHDLRFTVEGHRPLDEAMVTAGGVDTREVGPRTMASRRVVGLYFAGEVLDVQADTGGYNLQAAFSTGYLAGRSAAAFVVRSAHGFRNRAG